MSDCLVQVPRGCRAVFVSEQLLEHCMGDWTPVSPPAGAAYDCIEILGTLNDDGLTAEIQARYA